MGPRAGERTPAPRPLLLGEGSFPDHPGGLNRYLFELFRALRAQGTDVRAVVTGPSKASTAGIDADVPRELALLPRVWRFAAAAASAGRETNVTDVHFALYGVASLQMGGLRRRPLVVHFHGPWADESAATGNRSFANLAAKRALERYIYRRAGEIIVLSSAFKQLLVERYGVSPWLVTVIPPGVDLDRFTPGPRNEARNRLGVAEDMHVALTVRRLVPRMGVEVLLEAWARVSAERNDVLLLVAGEGPARPALEEQAARAGLGKSVRFVGALGEGELADAYRAADVCVVPSLALEGYGLVVLEALASGSPVVVTAVGGLPEAVAGLDRAAIVPPGDSESLAQRLSGVFDGDVALPSSAACRRHAESFSWQRAASRHQAVYTRQLRPNPTRHRLRVVYLDHCALLSGGELALLRLLPALDVDAHVVLGEDGPLVPRLLQAGVSVEVLAMDPQAARLRRQRIRPGAVPIAGAAHTARYVARLAVRLRRLRPDLVHTNSLKAALYGGVAARLAGVPCLWHIRDRVADDYLPGAATRLVLAGARRLPAAVIANSDSTLGTLAPALAGSGIPARVIHDPYHPERNDVEFRSGALQPAGGLRVGMVGRLAPWKGQHVFMEAFARAFPNSTAEGVIIGSPLFGEDDYAEELQRKAQQLGLHERLRFAGFVDDVEGELAAMDVLVHASVIPEPFGQVVVEGMAAGLPVVAPSSGGPSEVIEHGVEGLLYPTGDVQALADSLGQLAEDPGLRDRLGAAGRRRARDFEPSAIAAEVMEVYDAMPTAKLSRRKMRRPKSGDAR